MGVKFQEKKHYVMLEWPHLPIYQITKMCEANKRVIPTLSSRRRRMETQPSAVVAGP